MYDYLFKHGQTNTDENLRKSAAGLGLQIDKFDRDFNGQTHKVHLDEDIESGKSSGVKNTPTFFINGDRYDGAWDLDSLLSALDEESVFGMEIWETVIELGLDNKSALSGISLFSMIEGHCSYE